MFRTVHGTDSRPLELSGLGCRKFTALRGNRMSHWRVSLKVEEWQTQCVAQEVHSDKNSNRLGQRLGEASYVLVRCLLFPWHPSVATVVLPLVVWPVYQQGGCFHWHQTFVTATRAPSGCQDPAVAGWSVCCCQLVVPLEDFVCQCVLKSPSYMIYSSASILLHCLCPSSFQLGLTIQLAMDVHSWVWKKTRVLGGTARY